MISFSFIMFLTTVLIPSFRRTISLSQLQKPKAFTNSLIHSCFTKHSALVRVFATNIPDVLGEKHNISMVKPKVLVPIADGTEEMEAVTIIDTLVRAGADVTVASVMGLNRLQVACSRGVKLVADCHIDECDSTSWALICCPGGMPGAQHLSHSETLTHLLKQQNRNNKLIAAICAAPAVVLAKHGLLEHKRATCYPAEKFYKQIHGYSTESVVVSHNIITSRGPGTALDFALTLVQILFDREKMESLKREMIYQHHP